MAKWSVALMGNSNGKDGEEIFPQTFDIIAFKKYKQNEEQWSEHELKLFFIVIIDGLNKKEIHDLCTNTESHYRKYCVDPYELKRMGIDQRRVVDKTDKYQSYPVITLNKIKDKVKGEKIKDNSDIKEDKKEKDK